MLEDKLLRNKFMEEFNDSCDKLEAFIENMEHGDDILDAIVDMHRTKKHLDNMKKWENEYKKKEDTRKQIERLQAVIADAKQRGDEYEQRSYERMLSKLTKGSAKPLDDNLVR